MTTSQDVKQMGYLLFQQFTKPSGYWYRAHDNCGLMRVLRAGCCGDMYERSL